MSDAPGSKPSVFIGIQVLRGVAALLVVLHHGLAPANGLTLPSDSLGFGAAGVDIFFVISGFIIYTASTGSTQTAGQFVWRRAARIFPPYWVATLVLIFLHLAISMNADLILSFQHIVLSLALIAHDSPTEPGAPYPLLIPGWTLQYEIFFYLVYAFAFWQFRKHVVLTVTLIFLALVAIGILTQRPNDSNLAVAINVYTNPLLLEFIAGMLIGVVCWHRPHRLPLWAGALVPLGLVLLVVFDTVEAPRALIWGVPAVLIVLGTVSLEAGRERLKRGPLLAFGVLLGNASYSIYLTHTMALGFVRGAFRAVTPDGFTGHTIGLVLFLATCVVCSIAGGLLFYHVIERPSVRFATRLLKPDPMRVKAGAS